MLSKRLFMKINTPTTAIACGDQVKFFVTYNNESTRDVKKTKIELIRIDENRIDNIIKTAVHQVQSRYFAGASENSMTTHEINFKLPNLTPSSDRVCKIVNIFYEVHITASFDGAFDHVMKIPVFIYSKSFIAV
jgi:hypothetical protein